MPCSIPNVRSLLRLLLLTSTTAFLSAPCLSRSSRVAASNDSWNIDDDWSRLSDDHHSNYQDTGSFLHQHYTRNVLNGVKPDLPPPTEEEKWLDETLHTIQADELEEALAEDEFASGIEATMEREIAHLVHCNENPHQFLIQEGRALPPLSHEELFAVRQLLRDDLSVTPFLRESVTTIFDQHAVDHEWRAPSVVQWLKTCLPERHARLGPHDPRVTQTLALFGTTGVLSAPQLVELYRQTLVGRFKTLKAVEDHQKEVARAVWRDLRRHGILPPAEVERQQLLEQAIVASVQNRPVDLLMDECAIDHEETASWEKDEETGEWKKRGKSSYELVELANDKKTPLYMNDGDFVFIDEESCIGCMQCVTTSPASFLMAEDGRARTFQQRKSVDVDMAVHACPVTCMHYVGFDRLKELETARDSLDGDGRTDHRHFGPKKNGGWISRTPLHVSGRDSDSNHRSSWYHYMTEKCHKSNDCPQKGCFDCPTYRSDPMSNPHFLARLAAATHVRAEHFAASGQADRYRKTADL